MKYAIVKNGKVVNTIEWDGVVYSQETGKGWSPESGTVAILLPEDSPVSSGYDHVNGEFEGPAAAPIPPVTAAQVLAERSARLAAATREIGPLQDLIDLGEATPEDEGKLTEWKTYRAAVSKVHTQAGYPESVVWPQEPAL